MNNLGSYGSADPRDLVRREHSSVENVSPKLNDQSTMSEFKRLNSPEEPLVPVFLNPPIWGSTCVLKYAYRCSTKQKGFGGQKLWKTQNRNLLPGD